MKLEKAIKILTSELDPQRSYSQTDINNATRLGIEALKLIDNLRFDGSPYYPNELPGETKE